jgi:hypothetical protein
MSTSPNMLNLLEAKGIEFNTILSQLDETFPPVNPLPTDDHSLIMYRAGQRSVVEWITTQMEN